MKFRPLFMVSAILVCIVGSANAEESWGFKKHEDKSKVFTDISITNISNETLIFFKRSGGVETVKKLPILLEFRCLGKGIAAGFLTFTMKDKISQRIPEIQIPDANSELEIPSFSGDTIVGNDRSFERVKISISPTGLVRGGGYIQIQTPIAFDIRHDTPVGHYLFDRLGIPNQNRKYQEYKKLLEIVRSGEKFVKLVIELRFPSQIGNSVMSILMDLNFSTSGSRIAVERFLQYKECRF